MARKLLRDGLWPGFGAYREASFLEERAQLYSVPPPVLREAYAYAEKHSLEPEQDIANGIARVLLSRLGDGR